MIVNNTYFSREYMMTERRHGRRSTYTAHIYTEARKVCTQYISALVYLYE